MMMLEIMIAHNEFSSLEFVVSIKRYFGFRIHSVDRNLARYCELFWFMIIENVHFRLERDSNWKSNLIQCICNVCKWQ